MVAPLKKENTEQEVTKQQEKIKKYHTFTDYGQTSKFRELIFFARIALFAIITVCVAFLLLILNLPTILVFVLATLISLAITSTLTTFIWYLLK